MKPPPPHVQSSLTAFFLFTSLFTACEEPQSLSSSGLPPTVSRDQGPPRSEPRQAGSQVRELTVDMNPVELRGGSVAGIEAGARQAGEPIESGAQAELGGQLTAGEQAAGAEPQVGGALGGAEPPLDGPEPLLLEGLPRVYNLSGVDPQRAEELTRRALRGLGLDERTGPQPLDLVFVGRWYLAWLDETGFYGKMNGLWPLNGDLSDLDFVTLEQGRPVNALIVGERGDGAWPAGYMGSEHLEFPNSTPEANDDPSCASPGRFCAQYSHGEAHRYTDPDIPAWRACNEGSPSWGQRFAPYELEVTDTSLKVMYEGPLTKQGDFGGSSEGEGCHEDYLFEDGVRRRVYLRVGYELDATSPSLTRLLQVRNPEGNPRFDGSFSFIGGFVMSSWPQPHPLKRLNRFVRLEERALELSWGAEQLNLEPSAWRALPSDPPESDVVLGWAGQPVSLSSEAGYVRGQSFTLSHEAGEEDTGFCLCVVHGAIEMGGGLLSSPVEGGGLSHLARRTLRLYHELPPSAPRWSYHVPSELSHLIGREEAGGWSASTALDDAGTLSFGPYATDWGEGARRATFRLMVDAADERSEALMTLDVYDAQRDEVLVSRALERAAFHAPFTYQDFSLNFELEGRAGHAMEARVHWHDRSYVRLGALSVEPR